VEILVEAYLDPEMEILAGAEVRRFF